MDAIRRTPFPYKRTTKKLSPQTKQKISNSLRGRSKPASVRTAISNGLKQYYADANNFPDDKPNGSGYIENGEIV